MKTCKQKSINSANHFTGFCIIRTSIMKDLRSSSSTYLESLFLHVAKHNLLLFVCFFFYLAFLSQIFIIHRTAGEGRGYFLISFLPLPPAPQTLRYQLGYCCRELTSAQLAAAIEHGSFGTCSLEFTLSTLALVAIVVRRLLKTQATLGNISHVLLNLTKRLIFAMSESSSSLPIFTQYFLFS